MKNLLFIVLVCFTSLSFGQSSKNRFSIDLLSGAETGITSVLTTPLRLVPNVNEQHLFMRINYERMFLEEKSWSISSKIRYVNFDAPFMIDEINVNGKGLDVELMIKQRKYFGNNEKRSFYHGAYGTINYMQDRVILTGEDNGVGVAFELEEVNKKSPYFGSGYALGLQKHLTERLFIELETGLGLGFAPNKKYYGRGNGQVSDGLTGDTLKDLTSNNLVFTMKPSFLNLNVGLAF